MGDGDRQHGGAVMPASLAAAWGLADRPAKGPRPGLSLTAIVDAAISVAASDGLAAVSMGRVAKELGAAPMSLYRHVDSKAALLDLMVDRAYGEPPAPSTPEEGWRAGLDRWARTAMGVLAANPWVVQVPITGPPVTPNQVAWMESALASMAGARLAEGEKVSVLLLLSGFVRNEIALALSIGAPPEGAPGYGVTLAALTDRDRFPALHAVIDAGVFDDGGDPEAQGPGDPDVDFGFGLDRILDGIAALEQRRTP
ncbi:MAG: TetR/AcrR family transcriptional regulator [Actinomycetota bacterium]|nr:TetR/AcrR family transcriptional regulator [Actinomycetota bacterium]